MLAEVSSGTLVVSRLSVTVPEVPPPRSAVPAMTLVMVPAPVPGKVCPGAKLMVPFALKEKPVSVGEPLPAVESRFSVAVGEAVLLPWGSACNWKRGSTADMVEEL